MRVDRRTAAFVGVMAVLAVAAALLLHDCGRADVVPAVEAEREGGTAKPLAAVQRNEAAASQPADAEPALPAFTVRVVGGWPPEPIPDAYVSPSNHQYAWGTNQEGLVSLEASLRELPAWIVRHDRWEVWEGALPAPGDDGIVEIRLEPGGVIEGRLVGDEVVHEWRELRVLVRATPRNHEEFRMASVPDVPWIEAIVPVDPAGAFRVQGLKQELSYAVHAGGGGCIAPRSLRDVVPDAHGLELAILPLWGLQLEFREQGGAPLRCHEQLRTYHGFTWSRPSLEEAASVSLEHPALSLIGLRPSKYEELDFRIQTSLCASPTAEGLNLRCGVTFPGYARWNDTIELQRVRGSIPQRIVELEPVDSGWGSMELLVDGLPPDTPWTALCTDVLLVLTPQDPAMRERAVQLFIVLPRPRAQQGSIVENVPAGVYRVELYGLHDMGPVKRWGPQRAQPEIVVAAGGMARVSVDWSGHAHARFLGPMPAPVTIRRADDPESKWAHGGGPDGWATFAGLEPGAYEYSTTIARHPRWNQGPWTPFSVSAGRLAIVTLEAESGAGAQR